MKPTESLIAVLSAVAIVAVVILSIFVFSGQAFNVQRLIGEQIDSGEAAEVIWESNPAVFMKRRLLIRKAWS